MSTSMSVGLQLARPLSADPSSVEEFYRSALPVVYGYLLLRCGSPSVAEELTQETFVAAVGELKKGRLVEAPLSWVRGVARHKLLDYYRRLPRQHSLVEPGEIDLANLGAAADEAPVDDLTHVLAVLPSAQRAALLLRHVDGYSVAEVAAVLGRSVEAVESLLARGRAGFRRAYEEVVQ
jgi:RNA polymerase sigma-70 factor (ECF subfamily)